MEQTRTSWLKPISLVLFVAVVGGMLVITLLGTDTITAWFHKEPPQTAAREKGVAAELVRDAEGEPIVPITVRLTPLAASALGIKPETSVKCVTPKDLRPLPPQMGTLAYNSDRLFAVRTRFVGEVSEIMDAPQEQRGSIPRSPSVQRSPASSEQLNPPKISARPYTVGDRVKRGDILAIVWSKDLADKKAALIDALIDLRRDSARLKSLEKLYYDGSVSAATYFEAQRTVQKDLNARNSAERILHIWRLDDQEIEAIKRLAESIEENKRDPKIEKDWARVEIRASSDGVIVEMNTHIGDWVDPANYGTPMFRIADMTRLQVWINPSEEYLPVLQDFLKKPSAIPMTWDIHLQADPQAPPLTGTLLRIAPSLDYNQHTPLIVGLVDNPQGKLLVGQFVTATIYIPLEKDLVEIPTMALNEAKGQSVVIVQPDPAKLEFTVRPIAVAHRFKDVAYVWSKLSSEQAQPANPDTPPLQELKPGERVITESVVELAKAIRDLQAQELVGKNIPAPK